MSSTPRIVAPAEGQTYHVLGGDQITIKLTGEETGGTYVAVETLVPAKAGPPRHIHHRETETFYILEGDFEFHIGDDTVRASTGAFLFAPRDIPHHFRNVGDQPGKLLIVCHPSGFEHFVEEFATIPPDAPPDPAAMAALGAKYGIEFVPHEK